MRHLYVEPSLKKRGVCGSGEGEGEARRGALVALQTLIINDAKTGHERVAWSHVKDSMAFHGFSSTRGKISEMNNFSAGVFLQFWGGLSNDSNHHQS